MSEFLFLVSILLGFLIGTLLIGNLFYFFFVDLPNIIKIKLNGELSNPIQSSLKIVVPIIIWIGVSILTLYLISNYFSSYLKLFYCGAAISLVFNINTVFKFNKS